MRAFFQFFVHNLSLLLVNVTYPKCVSHILHSLGSHFWVSKQYIPSSKHFLWSCILRSFCDSGHNLSISYTCVFAMVTFIFHHFKENIWQRITSKIRISTSISAGGNDSYMKLIILEEHIC